MGDEYVSTGIPTSVQELAGNQDTKHMFFHPRQVPRVHVGHESRLDARSPRLPATGVAGFANRVKKRVCAGPPQAHRMVDKVFFYLSFCPALSK